MHELIPMRARRAFTGATVLTGLMAVAWYAIFHSTSISRIDANIYIGFHNLGHHRLLHLIATAIANSCDPSTYVLLAMIPVVVALFRRRPLVAGAVVLILGGASETTHLLKPLLATARPVTVPSQLGTGTWPSGHSTAAMALVLCCVIASSPRLRRYVAALGAVFALGVMYSVVTLAWHYPSDALGGLLVASIWTLIGLGCLFTAEAHWGHRVARVADARYGLGHELAPTALGVAAVACVGVLAILAHPQALFLHTSFVVGAAVLACLVVAAASTVAVSLRR